MGVLEVWMMFLEGLMMGWGRLGGWVRRECGVGVGGKRREREIMIVIVVVMLVWILVVVIVGWDVGGGG